MKRNPNSLGQPLLPGTTRLPGRSGLGRVYRLGCHGETENPSWRSSGRKPRGGFLAIALTALSFVDAHAQTTQSGGPAQQPGLSFDTVKKGIEPATDVIASVVLALASSWNYLMANPPAAVLLAAILGGVIAISSIYKQRETTRLRETFTAVKQDNWDEDLITARKIFGRIKKEIKDHGGSTAKYADPNEINGEDAITLQTIMNDYENIALGIRHNIIEEVYLFRWMRGALLSDWNTLSPLVTAFRHSLGSPQAYIEFEGLANAWQANRSYRTNRRLRRARRQITVD